MICIHFAYLLAHQLGPIPGPLILGPGLGPMGPFPWAYEHKLWTPDFFYKTRIGPSFPNTDRREKSIRHWLNQFKTLFICILKLLNIMSVNFVK